jgi:hypothetical protein
MAGNRVASVGMVIACGIVAAAWESSATPFEDHGRSDPQAEKISQIIDKWIAKRWEEKGVKPARPASDAEFLRRVSLDVGGRIPRVSEVRRFLDDPRPDRRAREVDRILEGAQYVNHFTNYWRALMIPSSNDMLLRSVGASFESWLRRALSANTPYDEMVRQILAAKVEYSFTSNRNPDTDPTLVAFYQANEAKPETLAAATSRLFLGVKLECAQCHDHPFANYTRQQFWEYAAFFSGIEPRMSGGFTVGIVDDPACHEVKIASTDKLVQAKFLDGSAPTWKPNVPTRAILADWVTSRDNPYFAKALVNRMWANFFGIGIIDPVDEPSEDNQPSHPELLDELAKAFVETGYNLKTLIRGIVGSQAYQLSSAEDDAGSKATAEDARLFRRMAIKGLSPEQFFDSLALAVGFRQGNQFNGRFFFDASGARAEFLGKFSAQERRTEYQTSILQALTLMNGKFVSDATDFQNLDKTELLAAVVNAPFLDDRQRVETLFLATLSRMPTSAEAEKFGKYVASGGVQSNTKAALADVLWVLLNSSEFMLNH